jgi:hypothetical protein
MSGNKLRLAVGYPWSSPFMFTAFVDSMLNLTRPPDCEVRFFRGGGWCPARRHIHLCEQAVDWKADLVLIVGSDQVHPEDMLCRLIDRYREGYDVVAALVPARGYIGWQDMLPFQPMAWRFKRDANGNSNVTKYRGQKEDGHMIEVIDPQAAAMQEVDFIGSGVLMFPVDVLQSLKRPWFFETIDPANMQRLANMDCNFVWRLKTEGNCRVWLDATIQVQHSHVFHVDESFQHRFEDWKADGAGDPDICRYVATTATP